MECSKKNHEVEGVVLQVLMLEVDVGKGGKMSEMQQHNDLEQTERYMDDIPHTQYKQVKSEVDHE